MKFLKIDKSLPHFRKKEIKHNDVFAVHTILSDDTPFVIRESYKMARTNIIFSVSGSGNTGCKMIAVTSAAPGEGKTTSTINIAIAFAQTGSRVLAIDCDLRKPRIHRYLGVKRNVGLTSVISGQATLKEAINKDVRQGLDILTSGELPPNPAELLSSERMKEVIEELSKDYDYIFFDTPPVTVVTDAAALSPFVDGVMIVVRQNHTDHDSLSSAINLLNIANAKLIGFFVNDVNKKGKYGGHYRKYGYSYGEYKPDEE